MQYPSGFYIDLCDLCPTSGVPDAIAAIVLTKGESVRAVREGAKLSIDELYDWTKEMLVDPSIEGFYDSLGEGCLYLTNFENDYKLGLSFDVPSEITIEYIIRYE